MASQTKYEQEITWKTQEKWIWNQITNGLIWLRAIVQNANIMMQGWSIQLEAPLKIHLK